MFEKRRKHLNLVAATSSEPTIAAIEGLVVSPEEGCVTSIPINSVGFSWSVNFCQLKKDMNFFTETTYALLKITLQICISKIYSEDVMPLRIHILYTSARLLASTNQSSIFNLHKFYERPGNKISEEKK